MLRLTANKTKLYTLVADHVDNLPPMRKTTFIKYPRHPDYALEWATEREKGRAFFSACSFFISRRCSFCISSNTSNQ